MPMARGYVRKSLRERMEEKTAIGPGGCWLWTGSISKEGYGRVRIGGLDPKVELAHRATYELLVGPISAGLELDHLCRVRRCRNPAHLEPVTRRENLMRSPALTFRLHREGRCKRGHAATKENVYRRKSNGRVVCCRVCRRERDDRKRATRIGA